MLIILLFVSCAEEDKSYLGVKAPGMNPEKFDLWDIDPVFNHFHSAPAISPLGNEIFFSIYMENEFPQVIYRSEFTNNSWSEPRPASFSGEYLDGGPFFSKDGKRLYFYSKRPEEGIRERKNGAVWYSENLNGHWSDPVKIEGQCDSINYIPSDITRENKLVLTSLNESGQYAVCLANITDNKIEGIHYCHSEINSDKQSNALAVLTPGEDALIFWRFDKKGLVRRGLFISYKDKNGEWLPAKSMGDMINQGEARFASFSPDGNYLFFTSYRSGSEEIYWIDAKIIDYLRDGDLNLIDRFVEFAKKNRFLESIEFLTKLKVKYKEIYDFSPEFYESVCLSLLNEKEEEKATEVMEYALKKFPDNTFLNVFASTFISMQHLKAEKLNLEDSLNFTEYRINQLGYRLIRIHEYERAREVFKINIKLFPKSANVYDSYAESLLYLNDTTKSIEFYKKALEVDPEFKNAQIMLKRLTAPYLKNWKVK